MSSKINLSGPRLSPQNAVCYFAWSISAGKNSRKYIKEELKDQLKRVFSNCLRPEEADRICAYHLGKTAEKHGDFPVWDYLILFPVKNQESADQAAEILRKQKLPFDYQPVRMELLNTTPESTYPEPGGKAERRWTKPFFAVEYVDVFPDHLMEFQTIMKHNNGPAMRYIMENKGWCYNFYALETVFVYDQKEGTPAWNQIHVIGLYLDSMINYKKDFAKGLRHAGDISFEDNFNRLKQIRTMKLKTVGTRVV
ncbi:hypothetical protein [Lacrimispora sp.]|uniref:hypothetical protein n=1 Tax=Lacrimispora sp. TaxID=2719234 RepID=UPI00399371AD